MSETEQEQAPEIEPDAEPEQGPEQEPESEPAPEPEPAPATGPSEADMEARIVKAERATKRYVSQVSAALEEDATNLIECPLCLPFARGFLHLGDRGRVDEDVQKAVRMWFGETQEVEYAPSPRHHTCTTCQGEGSVTTGSHVPKWHHIPCADCAGSGFMPPPNAPTNGRATTAEAEQFVTATAPPESSDEIDPSGEPRLLPDGRENPNFGRWPQYKIEIHPWGRTAGLLSEPSA